MQIRDYESGRQLRDVSIMLSAEEVLELQSYLGRLIANPEIRHVHLSEIDGCLVDKEISFAITKD